MKQLLFLLVVFLSVTFIVACGPSTPLPPTPTATSSVPTTQPTGNAKATENAIISHMFATMTASAPTATRATGFTATPARPTLAPTATRPRAAAATPRPATPVPGPAGSGTAPASGDPYLRQIPKGQGAILVVNYIGNRSAYFTIAGSRYEIKSNDKYLIVLAPDEYTFSVQVPGVANGGWSDVIQVTADRYQTYSVTLPQ